MLLVNPIRDGMNLVAKEGPILSERGCALVLSTEAGAAAELGPDALLVNPFDVTQTAEALHAALLMPDTERHRRRDALAEASAALPPTAWLRAQLDALDQPAEPPRRRPSLGPGCPAAPRRPGTGNSGPSGPGARRAGRLVPGGREGHQVLPSGVTRCCRPARPSASGAAWPAAAAAG